MRVTNANPLGHPLPYRFTLYIAFKPRRYVQAIDETREERLQRIDGMVAAMIAAYGGDHGILAMSYDPAEDMPALQSEWNLLKKHC